MEAPLYPPAQAYEQPASIAYVMTTANTSIATLQAIPAANAILLAEIPNLQSRIANPALKPHLGNFSPRSLVQFGVFKADALDRIDAKLRSIPAGQGA